MASPATAQTSGSAFDTFWEGIPKGVKRTSPARTGHRRTRGWLSLVLAAQAALSLRLRNAALPDETQYLAAGRDLMARLRDGLALGHDPYSSYFSGSPYAYPLAVGPLDDRFGLVATRGASLVLMLLATLCVYGMARRLAGPWAGVYGAAMFAVAQSTEALGHVATPDAQAVFLLALTGWLVIRSGTAAWLLLPAVLTATAMIVTKYATVLYLPTLVLLAILLADQATWRRACGRGALLAAGTVGLSSAALYFLRAFDGAKLAVLDQPKGTTPLETFTEQTLRWAAPVLVLALIGVIVYASPLGRTMADGHTPSNWRRLALGLLLTGTALIAPLTHLWLRNNATLDRDIGFGLLFAAVMAGVMLVPVAKARFIGPVLVLGLIGCALFNGFTESSKIFGTWPTG
jgi:hypothetical protein